MHIDKIRIIVRKCHVQAVTAILSQLKLKDWQIISLILTIALLVRLIFIDLREFWYDEAYSAITVRYSLEAMLQVIVNDVHPPLYYLLLRIWSLFFGSGVIALRVFSLLFGLLLLVGTYKLAKELVAKYRQLFAALVTFMLAISPFFIDYAVEARAYSMYAALFVWAIYFLLTGLKAQSKPLEFNRYLLYAGLLLAAMFWTHYVSAVGIFLLGLWLLWRLWTLGELQSNLNKSLWFMSKLLGPTFVAGLLWLPVLAWQFLRSGGGLWWVPTAEWWMLPRSLYAALFGVDPHATGVPPVNYIISEEVSILISALVFFSFSCGALYIWWRQGRAKQTEVALNAQARDNLSLLVTLSFGAIMIVAVVSMLVGVNLYVERYLTPYLLVWLVAFAYILWRVSPRLLVFFILLYFVISAFVLYQVRTATETTDFAATAQLLQTQEYGSCIYLTEDALDSVMLRFYMGDEAERIKLLSDTPMQYAGWAIINSDNVASSSDNLNTCD